MIRSSFSLALHTIRTPERRFPSPLGISRDRGLPHPEADPARTHPRASAQPYPRKHPGKPVLILPLHGMLFSPLRPDTLPLQPKPPDQHNPPTQPAPPALPRFVLQE